MALRRRVEYGITQLGSGLYWVRLRGKALGTFATIEQARARRDATVRVIRSKAEQVAPTVGTTLDHLYKLARARRVENEHRDIKTDDNRWKAHVSPLLGGRIAKELRPRDIQDFFRTIAKRNKSHRCKIVRSGKTVSNDHHRSTSAICPHCGAAQRRLSRSTQRHIINLVRVVLEFGVQENLLVDNAARGIRIRKEVLTEKKIFFLDRKQQDKLLQAIPLPQRNLVRFAMFSGLRLGELQSLELEHIHLDAEQPHVEVRFGGAKRAPTKVGMPRDVPLLPPAEEALRAWLGALPFWCPKNPLGLVFPRERGAHGGRKPPQHWHSWVVAAGLGRRLRFHDLRHTCACLLLNGQLGRMWSKEEVQQMLGHASITTTELYGKLMKSTLMRAAKETTAAAHAEKSAAERIKDSPSAG